MECVRCFRAKARKQTHTVKSRNYPHLRRCYIRSPAEGTGGGRGSKSGRNGSHPSRACSLFRHAVKSQPGRSVGRSSGASSNMASRWQSSAGSDARSATASDWSISARFVADSLESSVGTGQASSQVVRGSFSCSTAAPGAAHFQECAFFPGFTDISSGLKIPGPFKDVRVRVPPRAPSLFGDGKGP